MCMAPYHIFTSKWAGVVRLSGVGGTLAHGRRGRASEVAYAMFKVEVNESLIRLLWERQAFSEM